MSKAHASRILWIGMAALVALSGCSRRTPSDEDAQTNVSGTADSVAAQRKAGPPLADSTIVALGNEPFWNVRVTEKEILYRDPENQDGIRFPWVAAHPEGSALVFRTRREVQPGDSKPSMLELRVQPGACSDGMSDREYTMTATLMFGDRWYVGCAYYPAAAPWPEGERP